ncbi:MAG: replication factor A protein 2 [Sclerophora amabilis]|nr:MAG: replication factor A protein 2 [Sclerophora amabilis]
MNYDYNTQYQNTSYGAQGGAAGGGFVGGSQGGVPGSQQDEAASKYGKDTLRPVTIRQVVHAEQPHPDADFKIDGVLINQITFVGQIRNISSQTTHFTYKVDDGTAIIEVKEWIDSETASSVGGPNDPNSGSKLTEGAYVRVWGQLKSFGDKRTLKANFVRKIDDHNEIQFHLLEATAVHLYFTRGPPEQFTNPDAAAATITTTGGAFNQAGDGMDDQQQQQQQVGAGGKQLPPISANARRVYNTLLSSPQTNEGLHMHNVAAQLGMNVPDAAKAADELYQKGIVFHTVDEETICLMED